jgi:phosphatidylglycerophosphate synthase
VGEIMVYLLDENIIFKKYKLVGDKIREKCAEFILKLPISLTPNQITIISFIIGILAAISFAGAWILLGAILYYLSDVLDGVDGIIARKKRLSTAYGAYFDSCLDRYVDVFIVLGICIYLFPAIEYIWIIGILAIIGNFMLSYTTHRAEALGKVVLPPLIPWGRRTRMHVVVIGAILNQLFFVLIILALIGNLHALWRIMPWMLKDFNSVDKKTKKFLPKTSLRKFQKEAN